MHGRIRRRHLAHCLLILVIACATSCATAPPARIETPAIRDLREDYFRTFPEGPHNDHIRRGEVVRGMSLFEVLASWGIPDARVVSAQGDQERWMYVLLDDLSMDWVSYEYEFRNNALFTWSTSRNVANGLTLDTPEDRVDALSLPSWAGENQHGGAPLR